MLTPKECICCVGIRNSSCVVKIVKPSVPKYNGNPLEYSKIKAAFIVEVDKKEVYDDTEKLKFLLDAIECRG